MNNVQNLTTNDLRKILSIKEQIEELQRTLTSLTEDGEVSSPIPVQLPRKRRMSAAVRARIAAAARKRWANQGNESVSPTKKKRKVSRAVRAKMAAAARRRWAAAKAAGRATL
jgi:hypothetical protein